MEKNVDGELAAPLIFHYSKIRTEEERIKLIIAMRDALDQNENILYALSVDVYKALLNFLLPKNAFNPCLEKNSNIWHFLGSAEIHG